MGQLLRPVRPVVVGLAVLFVLPGCAYFSKPPLPTWQLNRAPTRHSVASGLARQDVPDARLVPNDLEASHPDFSAEHPRVETFVELFRTRNRGFFERALARSGKYVPAMTDILEEEGLPKELAYLPLIESGFYPKAVSRAGAVGPWQFIRATGKRYGLRIDQFVDERRDPVKSTRAAARYLRDLHQMFDSWTLSLAAYNTGEDRIARIKAKRGVESYWEMMERGYLHPETRDYVPRFLAALEIARAPEEHGFRNPEEQRLEYDVFKVKRSVSLRTLAKLAGVSTSEVVDLNPALLRGVTPPGATGYGVRVPSGTKELFAGAYERILRDARNVRSVYAGSASGTYRIRRGDTASGIARRFGVSTRALMQANGWKDASKIRAGRIARIPGDRPAARATARRATGTATASATGRTRAVSYRVRKGDTPAAIARRFGVSVQALMRHNGWSNPRRIRPGMTARIPVKGTKSVRVAVRR